MKGTSKLFAAAVILAFCGCHLLDGDNFPATGRNGTQREQADTAGKDSVLVPPGRTPKPDTTITCTAVRFPDFYDWRKDSLYGATDFDILLFQDGEITKTIRGGRNFGISSDPDMHHLIGSEIFTEYSSMARTVITRGGDVIADFEGREMLKGLLPQDGDTYTLSVGRDGYGFSYRKNGEIILKKDYRVFVYGSLEDPSYPETGALYEDDRNQILFCYRESNAHFEYHVVIDGVDSVVDLRPKSKILDMKVIDDSVVFVEEDSYDALWEEAYIPYNAPELIVGCVDGSAVVLDKNKGDFNMLCGRDATIYTNGNISAALYHPTRGKCSVYYTTGECRFYREACYFLTRRCAGFVGENLMVAINPVDGNKTPYLSVGDRKYEFNGLGNGFVSGFRVEVSQPN